MRRLGELTALDFYDSQARHRYFKDRLVGVESEALALEVCRLRLTLSDYPNGNGWSLHPNDVFTWPDWEAELKTTDVLLANPPFHSLSSSERSKYGAKKASAPAEMLRRVLQQPPSLMGLVLPPSFLTGPEYRDSNRGLAEAYAKVEYVELPENIFVYAKRATVALLCSERRTSRGEPTYGQAVSVSAKRVNCHSRNDFYQQGKASWETSQIKSVPAANQAFCLRVDPPEDIWALLLDAPLLCSVAVVHKAIQWKGRTDGLPKRLSNNGVLPAV